MKRNRAVISLSSFQSSKRLLLKCVRSFCFWDIFEVLYLAGRRVTLFFLKTWKNFVHDWLRVYNWIWSLKRLSKTWYVIFFPYYFIELWILDKFKKSQSSCSSSSDIQSSINRRERIVQQVSRNRSKGKVSIFNLHWVVTNVSQYFHVLRQFTVFLKRKVSSLFRSLRIVKMSRDKVNNIFRKKSL